MEKSYGRISNSDFRNRYNSDAIDIVVTVSRTSINNISIVRITSQQDNNIFLLNNNRNLLTILVQLWKYKIKIN